MMAEGLKYAALCAALYLVFFLGRLSIGLAADAVGAWWYRRKYLKNEQEREP